MRRRADADKGFLLGTARGPAEDSDPACFFLSAQRARCASEIRLRAAADSERPRREPFDARVLVRPDSPSITEIAWSNFSSCVCACFRSSLSC